MLTYAATAESVLHGLFGLVHLPGTIVRFTTLLLAIATLSLLLTLASAHSGLAASGDNESAPGDNDGTTIENAVPAANAGAAPARNGIPAFSHIIIVTFENKELDRIAGNSSAPFLNRLASQYTL